MDLENLIIKLTDDNSKRLLVIPLAVLALSLIVMGWNYATTGSPVTLGIEFTGGTLVTIPATESADSVAKFLEGYPVVEIREVGSRYMVQMGSMNEDAYSELAKKINLQYSDAEIRYMGPVYSKLLQRDAMRYVPISFVLMAVVVFAIFRKPFVSGIIVLCALSDILIAAGLSTAVGVKLSLGTVAALLMLIGYSVDTDILLSVRVIKRKGLLDEKVRGAIGTGFIMTASTLSAVVALMLVSTILYYISPSFTRIDILADISTVLFFGLLADMINTWITNVQALKWYMARPKAAARRRRR